MMRKLLVRLCTYRLPGGVPPPPPYSLKKTMKTAAWCATTLFRIAFAEGANGGRTHRFPAEPCRRPRPALGGRRLGEGCRPESGLVNRWGMIYMHATTRRGVVGAGRVRQRLGRTFSIALQFLASAVFQSVVCFDSTGCDSGGLAAFCRAVISQSTCVNL